MRTRRRHPGASGITLAGLLTVLVMALPILLASTLGGATASPEEPPAPPDPLATLGFEVTGGAAPGYVEDRACALCHNDLWRSYQEVGMARSFVKPRGEVLIEEFGEDGRSRPYFHRPSERWYQMQWRDDELTFRRWMEGEDGQPAHLLEQKVDWIMGSGHTSRVYLYRTPSGELFQLPLAWYSQNERGEVTADSGHWGMAPGYDIPDHMGVRRRVHRECMFCHNAYPDVPLGSDHYGEPHVFPRELPQGTGCQRCHGPGAEHVRTALNAQQSEGDLEEALRKTIVQPGRLSPERLNDVCFGCHFQPTVALHGARRFDRADYSFRPGEMLSEYMLKVDIEEPHRRRGERFEINHHAYRLTQSTCFRESRGSAKPLVCVTCHDPHRKVPAERRVEHYRQACLSCHTVDTCRLDTMAPPAGMEGVDPQDCATCHMPRRRTQDVIQVVMTDHRIQRYPPGPDRLKPLMEETPNIADVELLDAPPGTLGDVYRIVAFLRAGGSSAEAAQRLQTALANTSLASPLPYLDLARGQLRLGQLEAAERTLLDILETHPVQDEALSVMAIVQASRNHRTRALDYARRALAAEPRKVKHHFNLGRLLLGYGQTEEAVPHLRRAVELQPVLAQGWLHLSRALARLGDEDGSRHAHRQLLRVDLSMLEDVQAPEVVSQGAGVEEPQGVP